MSGQRRRTNITREIGPCNRDTTNNMKQKRNKSNKLDKGQQCHNYTG